MRITLVGVAFTCDEAVFHAVFGDQPGDAPTFGFEPVGDSNGREYVTTCATGHDH
jgi:hypothetical protein